MLVDKKNSEKSCSKSVQFDEKNQEKNRLSIKIL